MGDGLIPRGGKTGIERYPTLEFCQFLECEHLAPSLVPYSWGKSGWRSPLDCAFNRIRLVCYLSKACVIVGLGTNLIHRILTIVYS